MNQKPACMNCRFYDQFESPVEDDGCSERDVPTYGCGGCRRYPPVRNNATEESAFPAVYGDGWCGEYEP